MILLGQQREGEKIENKLYFYHLSIKYFFKILLLFDIDRICKGDFITTIFINLLIILILSHEISKTLYQYNVILW
jgi:hypothetical protein